MRIEKLKKLYLEVKPYSYLNELVLKDWMLEICSYEGFKNYKDKKNIGFVSPGVKWGKTGDTGFFTKEITVPEHFKGAGVYLEAITGGEAQVFIDGKAYQGNDPNHYRVFLSENCSGSDSYKVDIESYVRVSQNAIGEAYFDKAGTGEFLEAKLCAVDLNAQEFLWDIEFALEYAEAYGDYTYNIEKILTELFTSVDFTDKGAFLSYVPEGKIFLEKQLEALGVQQEEFMVWMIGQSHLDMAWFWRKDETYRKVVRTFSSVLRNMERYPFYQFMMPQVKLYKMLKEAAPEVFEEVKERVKEGRVEIAGQMYVEPDTNLVAGEWLVRQILLGRKFYKQEFGKVPKVESLIDAFGYSGSLPQILKKSGMDSVMVTKMMWYNDTNKFPYSAFRWKGIDGSEVLAATMPWFNRPCTNDEVKQNIDRNQQKHIVKEIPVFYGWGDGGGGADENHLKGLKRLMKWHKHVKVRTGTLEGYFENLSRIQSKLPSWWGEIYQEGHRGCYTSQARNKKFNRESESLYRALEFLYGFEYVLGGENKYPKLQENIELILINQFHDVLPGSAANKTYKDSYKDYEKILGEGRGFLQDTLQALGRNINTTGEGVPIVLWNFNGTSKPGVIKLKWSGSTTGKLLDSKGREVPFGFEAGVLTFVAEYLPSIGYEIYRFVEDGSVHKAAAIETKTSFMENNRYKIAWNAHGQICEIYDKYCDRELLKEGSAGNRLTIYFDYPLNCDAWDLDLDYRDKFEVLQGDIIGGVKNDELKQWITIAYTYGKSTIEQDIVLYNGMDKIDFVNRIDWHESHKLLKANFDFQINASKASFDIPFGVIERDTHHNNSYQKAQFEVPALSFADLSEGNYGVAIVSPHKNGFFVKDSEIGISLLRSPKFPDFEADQGYHEFSYSIIGHGKDFRDGGIIQESRAMLYPIIAYVEDDHNGNLPGCFSFISADKPNVIVEALKLSEDGKGLIMRVFEAYGQQDKITMKINLPVEKAEECNLVEEVIHPVLVEDNQISFCSKPFEIKSFRLTFK